MKKNEVMYTYFGERDMERVLEKGMEKKEKIITNVKIILKGEKEVPYISQKGYSDIDVELLYHAIKHATISDLELFKKTGKIPFSDGYIDISKRS